MKIMLLENTGLQTRHTVVPFPNPLGNKIPKDSLAKRQYKLQSLCFILAGKFQSVTRCRLGLLIEEVVSFSMVSSGICVCLPLQIIYLGREQRTDRSERLQKASWQLVEKSF